MEGEGQGIVACGRILALGLLTFCFVFAAAAIEIPKASGKALGVTRGKPFEKGLVFVNGRYLESPYVVERWGTGIRINKVPVIGQVVDWTEFLKTQDGVKVIKTEVPPPQAAEREPEAVSSPEPVSAPPEKEIAGSDDFDPSLDDLFEDEPQPQKKKADVPQAKPVARKPKSVKPIPTVTYALEGEFSANDASKALLKKVNDKRTQINAQLLDGEILFFSGRGGCIPCGRLTEAFLGDLVAFQKECSSEEDFVSRIRSAGYIMLSNPMCKALYRNRVDYLKLQNRLKRLQDDTTLRKKMNEMDGRSRL